MRIVKYSNKGTNKKLTLPNCKPIIFKKNFTSNCQTSGTLHSLGADNRMVEQIFVAEGWLISIVGAVTGLAVGVVLCVLQQHFGFIQLSADASNLVVNTYPVAVSVGDVAMILGIVAVVGLLASLATTRAMRGYLYRK